MYSSAQPAPLASKMSQMQYINKIKVIKLNVRKSFYDRNNICVRYNFSKLLWLSLKFLCLSRHQDKTLKSYRSTLLKGFTLLQP